jgi:2-oxoglutarate dehydrogenase E1 component
MYRAIREHKSVCSLYAERLVKQRVVTAEEAQAMWDEFTATLEAAHQARQNYKPDKGQWLEGYWEGLAAPGAEVERTGGQTGVNSTALLRIGAALSRTPAGFDLHPKITRQLEAKRTMFDAGGGIDWATGEALAFGSLLLERKRVRLSGEDSQRGTFSQRHAVLIDQTNQNEYVPLNNIAPDQAKIEIYNSLLSEAGVLGFEYGYTLADPHTLVLWEAQFGDFGNGAQVIIDQFLASGESKWLRSSGLVLLLPHGYEGQGPEHSSARLERYLQLCAEDNMAVANPTTPANYFHALRRQLHRNFRKPLVLMTPKSLLRHKLAVSPLADFATGNGFLPIIPEIDTVAPDEHIRRIVLCTGKVYYDLLAERRERRIDNIAIVRVEQLYPFPADAISAQLSRYRSAEVVWSQEEPENMGAWTFVGRRIERLGRRATYVGRSEAASPATGLARTHAAEQAALVNEALTIA